MQSSKSCKIFSKTLSMAISIHDQIIYDSKNSDRSRNLEKKLDVWVVNIVR